MRTLSDLDVLDIWERAQDQHPIDRALAILVAAAPDRSRDELAKLSVGRRDGLLLDVYAQLFGPRLHAASSCAACGDAMELTLRVEDVRAATTHPAAEAHRFSCDEYAVEYRLPDSFDLAEIAAMPDAPDRMPAAKARLLERCVRRASDRTGQVAAADLPPALIEALAAQMELRDPQAVVTLSTTCPACGLAWPLCFDIATFLWTRIAARARQLLADVHQLARAYGWCESEVLRLSARRRRHYLELVS